MNTKLTMKVGLLYRLVEGWLSVDAIAARLRAPLGDVRRSRDWLEAHGYLERGDETRRWLPTREFEELWKELVPDRPCPLSFCQSRGAKRLHNAGGLLG